jgi:elongation factor G
MSDIAVSDIRNFAILGHAGCGKTTLTEALLFALGLNERLGSVASGTSMADYSDEEKARKITIFAKPFNGTYKNAAGRTLHMVFLDTPGYMDFYGQVLAATCAADLGLVVVDAASGVAVGTRHAWRACEKKGLARAVVVTGLDRENTDYAKTVAAIRATFGKRCVPVNLPAADGTGVADVFADGEVAPSAQAIREESRAALLDVAAESDDSLLEKYLGGETLSEEEIGRGLAKAVAKGSLAPVFACLPLKNVGIKELLEGAGRLFPPPAARAVKDAAGNAVSAAPDGPFLGFVWRTVNDPFIGQLAFVRVMSGVFSSDSEAQNASQKTKERVGSLLFVNGRKQAPADKAVAGQIVAVPKLKATVVGDTLCAMGKELLFDRMAFPKPVMFLSVSGKTQADEDKISTAIQRVAEEDPTLRVERNTETKQMLLGGLGDVHLEVAVERMKSRSNVDVILSTPKVPYRETVTGKGEGHYKHKKQTGGRGQYGEVYLRVEPRRAGDEEWFVDAVVGGVIPGNFIPAVQKGVVEGMAAGAVAGYPVTDVKISVYDGSYHEVDSSEIAFKIAGARAFKDGMAKAKPVLLEPIMTVKVTVPEQYMGDITGDLNQKRGRILGMAVEEGMQAITAELPQAELFRYAAELRSRTAGQGSFEMEFNRYEVVPSNVAQKVVAAAAKDKEKDKED